MIQQSIQFTVMPRGLTLNPATLPISVMVSPRLSGAQRLGKFPDWLAWTEGLQKDGLKLVLRCGTKNLTVSVDPQPLRPDLWRAMFNADTYVRPYSFPDYTQRAIFSYPVRLALSALKSAYQEAGVVLALPEQGGSDKGQRENSRARFLKGLLEGFEVNWDQKTGERLREQYRAGFGQLSASGVASPKYDPNDLNADGTLKAIPAGGTPAAKGFHQFVAGQFATYTHIPQGQPIHDNLPDFDTLIDFHQALSSLNSYPELLRALGLVFDLDLPADFVATTTINAPGRLAVVDVLDHTWQVDTIAPPKMPAQETAYLYFGNQNTRMFTTAPGLLGGGLTELDVFGLLTLDPTRYGLAQSDVESGMHKMLLLAETWQDGRPGPNTAEHPEIFDETTTLPALRSGGLSVYADARSLRLARTVSENKQFNENLEKNTAAPRPFFAEDLNQGYRVDIWDSFTKAWHSLHRRLATYTIGEITYQPKEEVEGFTQLAAAQPAPDPENPPPNDLYLNESMARWMGWSLSAPFPGKSLSADPDPAKALDEDPNHPANEPATPFKMTTAFTAAPKSLPALRFGRRYRMRLRAVDISGNSMKYDDPLAGVIAMISGLPRDPEGLAYLRYEPVAAPLVVLRDAQAVTGPGSQLLRLVMRTFNDQLSKDSASADLTASDRFIVPPSTSVEMGERMGMFDDQGKLNTSPAMYTLIAQRDAGRLKHVKVVVAGQEQEFPLESAETLDDIPYLPDVLARGAALRDLPGAPDGTRAAVEPGNGAQQALPYSLLEGANPRSGSAALVSFGGGGDWQHLQPFRLALADDGAAAPLWDADQRILTISLPKGSLAVVPLSSYLPQEDLKLLGVWQWLREIFDLLSVADPGAPVLTPHLDVENLAHILQRAVEGGHWMLTPPTLLTLVHAVQQPLGRPDFRALTVQHEPYGSKSPYGQVDELINPDPNVLQTAPEADPTAASELTAITSWRKPGAPDAYLLGGLQIHANSTGKIDLEAEWEDPYDDLSQPREEGTTYLKKSSAASVEEIQIPNSQDGYLNTGSGKSYRSLAYYNAEHDLLCFTRDGDQLGNLKSGVQIYRDAAPRHYFNDTLRHRVLYTPRATSRFREYFAQDADLDFTRPGEAVWVDVPASARPSAPQISYIVPTFGWQRESHTNLKRSVRFGGGLRIYLERPWFSSGMGELLGVTLYDYGNGSLTDREKWKAWVTQWGADPIWQSPGLPQLPYSYNFPNRAADEISLSVPGKSPGRVGVAGFAVDFDYDTQKWFADVTVDTESLAYTPFLRLALVRYQPFALPDAKLSPVVLADYIQITPERSALLSADPYHARRLHLTVSGPAPSGPAPQIGGTPPTHPVNLPTQVEVSLQHRSAGLSSDLAWEDAPAATAAVRELPVPPGLLRWSGNIDFAALPEPDEYRLVIREYEYLSASDTNIIGRGRVIQREQPKRLIYAETFPIDSALIGAPGGATSTQL